jgi:hypothetical protein
MLDPSKLPNHPQETNSSAIPVIRTHSAHRLTLNACVSHWRGRAAAAVAPQSTVKLLEHLPWDGDFGHLEGDTAAEAQHLRGDLDQLLLQARQRPVTMKPTRG